MSRKLPSLHFFRYKLYRYAQTLGHYACGFYVAVASRDFCLLIPFLRLVITIYEVRVRPNPYDVKAGLSLSSIPPLF